MHLSSKTTYTYKYIIHTRAYGRLDELQPSLNPIPPTSINNMKFDYDKK